METSKREQRIRERAYFLWLAAGRPNGAALLHWRQAEAIEDGGSGDFQANEAGRGNADSHAWTPNLGHAEAQRPVRRNADMGYPSD